MNEIYFIRDMACAILNATTATNITTSIRYKSYMHSAMCAYMYE